MQFVDEDVVLALLSGPQALTLSREAFRLQFSREIEQPLRNIVPGERALMGTMPVYVKSGAYAGFAVKSIVVRLGDGGVGPSHAGLVIVYGEDVQGGVAAVHAGAITELRTAAASALATDLLAAKDAKSIAILGTGVQARAHLRSIFPLRSIKTLSVWGRNSDHATAFVDWAKREFNISASAAQCPAAAVAQADIICTTTAAREPILRARDLPPHCHLNAIGASARGFQELHEDIYAKARIYVDSIEAVSTSSTSIMNAIAKGIIAPANFAVEVGAILDMKDQVGSGQTIFKSVGLAVQDAVFAREAIRLNAARVIAQVC